MGAQRVGQRTRRKPHFWYRLRARRGQKEESKGEEYPCLRAVEDEEDREDREGEFAPRKKFF